MQAAPPIPGAAQDRPRALIGGTVHPVVGADIEKGTVLFVNGRITAVGRDVAIPADAEKIDVSGKHVYPGLIDAYTQVGLVEIDAVRATNDIREIGLINPNVRAQVAFNPDSEIIPVARAGGVLVALSAPTGGAIAGTSALMQLDGWTWEEMAVKSAVGMHLHWPFMRINRVPGNEEQEKEARENRAKALEGLRDAFADARAYGKAKANPPAGAPPAHDLRWEAMQPVLEGKLPLIVHADELTQIEAAVAFAAREGAKMILLGGYDAPDCAALLKRHNVPVLAGPIHRLPMHKDDPYDAPFTLPERLREAGLKYCIVGEGGGSNTRNLPYHAAMAAGHGLSQEEALKSITLYPAQILGVADRLGSLEAGKDATLIVTTGDPLDIRSQVEQAYIAGRTVDLNNKQRELWLKYREKYRRQGAK